MAAASTTSWPWLFQMRSQHSEELKDAQRELIEEEEDLAELDFTDDEHLNKISGCVAWMEKSIRTESSPDAENDLQVNFTDRNLKLPEFVASFHSVDDEVKATDIRYIDIVGGTQEGVICDNRVVLLSIWTSNGRVIVNIYLQMPGIKESLMLANSVSKLMYEACGKSAVRLKKFFLVHSGVILLSSCTTEERDSREKVESEKAKPKSSEQNGSLEADAVRPKENGEVAEESMPLEKQKMFFTLDEESLCLLEHPLSPRPTWDFRFYKESLESAIDCIYVCNTTGELEIEQQQKVFYIKSMNKEEGSVDEHFTNLSKLLCNGTLKPKPQEIFKDLKKFVDYFSEGQASKKTAPAKKSAPKVDTECPVTLSSTARQPVLTPHPPTLEAGNWMSNLLTGSHLETIDEELQVKWFSLEDALDRCLKENVPEAEIESAELNPESAEHLQFAVRDIREKLQSNEFQKAISHLRAVRSVFKNSFLKAIDHVTDVEILKRIFFLYQ